MNVQDIDLNLLTALDVLLEELNVSRAASRLGVTQPAMSSTLKRLRALLGDPVLVRTPAGMIPTAKAQRLKGRLRQALSGLQTLIDDDGGFDPATTERTMTIGLNDYASLVVLPHIYPRLKRLAPKLKLQLQPRKNIATSREDLETGTLDFAIGIGKVQELPGSLITRRLFDDPFLTMMRRDHPAVQQELTFAEYLKLDHLVVSPQGHDRGIIDDLLAKEGQRRHVALVVPHFAVAARLVAESDLVCTIPGRIAELYADFYPIKMLAPPLPLVAANVTLAWHSVQHENPVHRWMREQITSTFSPSQSDAGTP